MAIRITSLPNGETEVTETGDGTEFSDRINGTDLDGLPQAEVIRGFGDNDILSGGRGRDELFGGDGSDSITGGRGRDVLKGGSGTDFFTYEYPRDGNDKITDFVSGEDWIMLVASGGGGFLLGAEGLAFDANTNRLTYDYDGIGGLKPVLIAKLNTDIDLAHDIIFI